MPRKFVEQGPQCSGMLRRRGPPYGHTGCCRRFTTFPQGRCPVGVAQPYPARLGGLQGRLSALTYHLTLMLGNCGQQVECEAICLRHVACNELNAPIHQVSDEGYVSGQSIQLRDYQSRPVQTARRQRSSKLRPASLRAGLHLNVFA
jgi:hypothetical protein